MPCYAILCCVMLMLYYVMLCYVMLNLCYAVLCYSVLCNVDGISLYAMRRYVNFMSCNVMLKNQ